MELVDRVNYYFSDLSGKENRIKNRTRNKRRVKSQ